MQHTIQNRSNESMQIYASRFTFFRFLASTTSTVWLSPNCNLRSLQASGFPVGKPDFGRTSRILHCFSSANVASPQRFDHFWSVCWSKTNDLGVESSSLIIAWFGCLAATSSPKLYCNNKVVTKIIFFQEILRFLENAYFYSSLISFA